MAPPRHVPLYTKGQAALIKSNNTNFIDHFAASNFTLYALWGAGISAAVAFIQYIHWTPGLQPIGLFFMIYLGIACSREICSAMCTVEDAEIEAKKLKMTPKVGAKELERIAVGCGLRFELITEEERRRKPLDPDKVYLKNPETPIKQDESNVDLDAVLYWNGITRNVIFENLTEAAVRKMFLDHNECRKCGVCWEEIDDTGGSCPKCNGPICPRCIMKLALIKPEVKRILSSKEDYRIRYHCPQCRQMMKTDMRCLYHLVMDRLSEFNKSQQKVLKMVKRNDPMFKQKMKESKFLKLQREMTDFCRLKKGSVVRLEGLEEKKEWNGKRAVVVGERTVEMETIRWPVRLMDGSDAEALVKPVNFVKLHRGKDLEELPEGVQF